ncbi:histidine phosphatase family protein [Sulfitobacter sp. D35]|uniref:histidine phosphatase family protein n=1 Tax=Sulfitobacter sp. D35 TaxID=3083252 RepID=UPI00296E3A5E|nr:histidine phosphatase family protein [Sulfitobacter sp. D35]MDW4499709.1 histidine phosphatase family protein [Sulfitobacter sp. D35]
MTRLALLRHGHTAWNRAGRIQGRSDIPLDAAAETELSALSLPAPWNAADLRSSPLSRAVRTAELVAGRPPRADAALIEMHWGAWEGCQGAALRADPGSGYRDIEDWGWEFRPPGGESLSEMRTRLRGWAEALTEDTVAVCHIGTMRVLLAHAMGWDFTGPAPFRIKRGRLFIINTNSRGWTADPSPIRLVERHR